MTVLSGAKGLFAALRARLAAARPSLRVTLAGSAFWALCGAGSAACALWLKGWRGLPLADVALVFAAGHALAFAPALWLGCFVGGSRRREPVFAAVFLALACLTVAFTGLVFAWRYRAYYAQWHEPVLSLPGLRQLVYTVVLALYQFAVLGLPDLFPLGFAALLLVAFATARRLR